MRNARLSFSKRDMEFNARSSTGDKYVEIAVESAVLPAMLALAAVVDAGPRGEIKQFNVRLVDLSTLSVPTSGIMSCSVSIIERRFPVGVALGDNDVVALTVVDADRGDGEPEAALASDEPPRTMVERLSRNLALAINSVCIACTDGAAAVSDS
jgi:hypothetical protein